MITCLRKATRSDIDFAKDCAEEAYALYVERIGKRPAPMDQDFAAAVMASELDIIEHGDASAGFVLWRAAKSSLFVENVAVLPSAQGKGIARWLFATLEDRALALGLTTIELYTNANMHENLNLYARLGFEIFDRRAENGFDRIYFCKRLGA